MNANPPQILTLNGGSSSIKFALYEAGESPRRVLSGGIDGIGTAPGGRFYLKSPDPAENFSIPSGASTYTAATDLLLQWLMKYLESHSLSAAGHRIVHGGPNFGTPQRVTPEMIAELRRFSPFDPEHLPAEISLIDALQHRMPQIPQVACFDTAFHHDLPTVARLLPIPRRYAEQGVRRYGFHGLSYAYLAEELARLTCVKTAQGRVIFAHLGNGSSMAAVCGGKPIDTSMGFTPTAGLVMSTRSGDLDPGLACYFAETEQMTPIQFQHMVNHESGLIGISETSSDMRELLIRETQDARAAEAVSLFCYQAKKWIGAFTAAMGGLDALVFSGGIGENSPQVRFRICDGLGFLGLELNAEWNSQNQSVISTAASRVEVRVIPTNEELMIAKSVCRVLGLS